MGDTGYKGVIGKRPVFVSRVELDSVDTGLWPFGNVLHRFIKDPEVVKSVVSKVSQAGVLVPDFIGYSKEGNVTYNTFRKIGNNELNPEQFIRKRNTLGSYLRRLEAGKINTGYMKQLRKLLSSAARSIGAIHSIGILQGHPHFNNFIPVKSRVAVIDFKLSRTRKVDWSDERSIRKAFRNDYVYLVDAWRGIELTYPRRMPEARRMKELFFTRMVGKYPAPQGVKRQLIERLVQGRLD